MKSARFLLVLAIPIIGGACATPMPRHDAASVVPVPAEWDAADTASGEPLPAWDELFDDAALAPLIEEALRANRTLDAAAARVERAVAQARIAGADLDPQVALSFDAARRKQNFIGLPIPGAEGRVLSNTSSTFGTGLNVSWEADLWGRIRSGRNAAEADLEAVRADYAAARLSLSAQVARNWFAIVEAAQQLELATATLENRTLNAERVRRRYEAGLASSVDLRLAESNAALAESRVAQRRRQLDAATRQLEILLGRYPAAELDAAPRLPELAQPVTPGIPASVIARRPDIRAAERRAAASSARIRQARAALYPQLRLTGSTGTSTNELQNLVDGDFSVWNLVANVLQPVFNGGRLRAGVELAEAVEEEALAGFAQTVLAAYAEIETSLFAQDVLARQEEALLVAAGNAREAQRTAEQRYASGLADYLLVLESQRQAFEAESQLLDARRQRLAARVDLYVALGGVDSGEEVK